MTDIQRIQIALAAMDIESEIDSYGTHLYGKNNHIVILVVSSHKNNTHKWLLRMSPRVSFDRWANSTALEETFESAEHLIQYLYDNDTNIFLQLFESLSEEYRELDDEYKTLIFGSDTYGKC